MHSFDFIAANDHVIACDMAHVPLKSGSVDVAVFCLSLMGTNLRDYFLEANRVLKVGLVDFCNQKFVAVLYKHALFAAVL